MSATGYACAALLVALCVLGFLLKSELKANGILETKIEQADQRHRDQMTQANAVTAAWKTKYESGQQDMLTLQKTVADRQREEALERLKSESSRRTLTQTIERLKSSDPKNCIIQPVHTGVDRRLRDAGARMSTPVAAGDG